MLDAIDDHVRLAITLDSVGQMRAVGAEPDTADCDAIAGDTAAVDQKIRAADIHSKMASLPVELKTSELNPSSASATGSASTTS